MKAYGIPRNLDLESPDLVDIANYGMKTSNGQIKSKGGDYRGSTKTKNRNKNRKIWKKKERNQSKNDIYKELNCG